MKYNELIDYEKEDLEDILIKIETSFGINFVELDETVFSRDTQLT